MSISFSFPVSTNLPNRSALKRFIYEIFQQENKALDSLSIIFCSDDFLLKINQDYLNHNYFTDIITFDLTGPGTTVVSGEMYISVDTVRDNASRFSDTMLHELHRVIFHGVLHLCGYGDKTKTEQDLMRARENHYLHIYFNVPRGTSLPSKS